MRAGPRCPLSPWLRTLGLPPRLRLRWYYGDHGPCGLLPYYVHENAINPGSRVVDAVLFAGITRQYVRKKLNKGNDKLGRRGEAIVVPGAYLSRPMKASRQPARGPAHASRSYHAMLTTAARSDATPVYVSAHGRVQVSARGLRSHR